jgi:CRP-like cAMP-binding protein
MVTSGNTILVNRLLSGLPERSRKHLLARSELVALDFGAVLCDTGDKIRHAYFPTAGFISVVAALDDGASLEVAIAGPEGMLGIPLILGTHVSPHRAVVQGAGSALRVTAAEFGRQLQSDATLRRYLNRYVSVWMAQLTRCVACTHFHRLSARLARWLLMTRDRAQSNQFRITHEFLAHMLGVRRAGVTRAAGVLQVSGLIRYRRGEIEILDGRRLERVACRCYHIDAALYERIMSV